MRWFNALMPRETKFVDLFVAHAATLVDGADALRRLLEGGAGIAAACAEINAHEETADVIARDTLLAVRRTFITPFDRSDIKDLASSLDDAIDQMKKTAKAVTQFEVTSFQPQMREIGDLIVRAAAITAEAMPLMAKLGPNAARLNAMAEEITKLEERADEFYDSGLKALFLASRKDGDAMAYIVGAEIYDHLEKVVDRFEDVANRISGILIENL
jgi:predicted phosphate transport protein (TIGR00153 family)